MVSVMRNGLESLALVMAFGTILPVAVVGSDDHNALHRKNGSFLGHGIGIGVVPVRRLGRSFRSFRRSG